MSGTQEADRSGIRFKRAVSANFFLSIPEREREREADQEVEGPKRIWIAVDCGGFRFRVRRSVAALCVVVVVCGPQCGRRRGGESWCLARFWGPGLKNLTPNLRPPFHAPVALTRL